MSNTQSVYFSREAGEFVEGHADTSHARSIDSQSIMTGTPTNGRVSVQNGQETTELYGTASVHVSHQSNTQGQGLLATAHNDFGLAAKELTDKTRIGWGAEEMSIGAAVAMGLLRKEGEGRYVEVQQSAPAPAPEQSHQPATFSQSLAEAIGSHDNAASLVNDVVAGNMDERTMETYAHRLGISPEEAAGMMAGIEGEIIDRLSASAMKQGISDIEQFGQWATETQLQTLRQAALEVAHHGSSRALTDLVLKFQQSAPKADPEASILVTINGEQMPLPVARRRGLVK